jgi:hypothetical protein
MGRGRANDDGLSFRKNSRPDPRATLTLVPLPGTCLIMWALTTQAAMPAFSRWACTLFQ